MCLSCDGADTFPVPLRREYRRRMKHSTARKVTALHRIELNRLWNDLEDMGQNRSKESQKDCLDQSIYCFEAIGLRDQSCQCDVLLQDDEGPWSKCYCSLLFEGHYETEEDSYFSNTEQQFYCLPRHQRLPHPPSFQQTRNLVESMWLLRL